MKNLFCPGKSGGGAILSSLTEFVACKNLNVCYNGDILHHYYKGFKLKKFAFTLAEVLITLGIIGVVAAMTMPALIGNYQKRVVIEHLKKVYNTMKQVEAMAIANSGDIDSWEVSWNPRGDKILLNNYILPYVDTLKVCMENDCPYKYMNTQTTETDLTSNIGFYLKDGTLIKISQYHVGPFWGEYIIDINGEQKPNKVGRDVFFAWFQTEPGGATGNDGQHLTLFYFASYAPCYRNVQPSLRSGCYRKIVNDGWQIKDDYPWNF